MHWAQYLLFFFYLLKNSYCNLILAERPDISNLHDKVI